jgi:hypothetical protein
MGAILQRGVGKYPQGICLGNSNDHGAHLDEGVPSLSFQLEGIQQVVPYEHIGELLGFQKVVPEKVDVPEGMLDGFWNLI